ncbi:hypothetical protein I7I51_08021 [Histoplasma capsulatum]|uniref:Uncharacterized protein n=1 Tax=Ajellomyces capsulatus TaxID=5037 RepID=A0A8A1M1Q4_AJECA|nr:hypothetical protein I7I51_08021 [Histoplasma capsulatum]
MNRTRGQLKMKLKTTLVEEEENKLREKQRTFDQRRERTNACDIGLQRALERCAGDFFREGMGIVWGMADGEWWMGNGGMGNGGMGKPGGLPCLGGAGQYPSIHYPGMAGDVRRWLVHG